MDYANIMKAIGSSPTSPDATMADFNRRMENNKLLDQMNNEGISLKDVLSQIDELKKKVESLEKPAQTMDEDLFIVMESAVHDDPSVIDAKRRVSEEKTRVIAELCAKDAGFMTARDEYRRAVNQAYVRLKETKDPKQKDE